MRRQTQQLRPAIVTFLGSGGLYSTLGGGDNAGTRTNERRLRMRMAAIHAGEIWSLSLGDKRRDVTVVAATGSPAWWRCANLETGLEFMASERWFVSRVSATELSDAHCAVSTSS
jgi:hypothetical protein